MDYSKIPFAAVGDKDTLRGVLHHRLRITKEFMGDDVKASNTIMDIGSDNLFARSLGIHEHPYETDYNVTILSPSGKKYDVVTCFEILEHLMNPLGLMQSIHKMLKRGGVCYLSTPKAAIINWYCGPKHFAEYKRDRLETMFKYVGFEVVKYRTLALHDWWTIFTGFRPPLRYVLQRSHLWKLTSR